MSDETKEKIRIFFAGVGTAVLAVIAFVLGRNKVLSDGDGIRTDNNKLDDCAERTEDIERRVDNASDGVADSLRILESAKNRAEKK